MVLSQVAIPTNMFVICQHVSKNKNFLLQWYEVSVSIGYQELLLEDDSSNIQCLALIMDYLGGHEAVGYHQYQSIGEANSTF